MMRPNYDYQRPNPYASPQFDKLRQAVDDELFSAAPEPLGSGTTPSLGQYTIHPSHLRKREAAAKRVDGLMRAALQGESITSDELGEVVTDFVAEFSDQTRELGELACHIKEDEGLADHCLQTSLLALAIGIELELDADSLRDLGTAGLLHDWGMSLIPEEIRHAKRKLTDEEWMQVQRHPTYSLDLISKVEGLPKRVALAAYQVHERLDGSGYPRATKAHRTHQFAKILAVADVYRALISARPQRPPLSAYAAMEYLIRKAHLGKFDTQIVRTLLKIVTLFPVGNYVLLSDGCVAVVVKGNDEDYTNPLVKLLTNKRGDRMDGAPLVDLASDDRVIVKALVSPSRNETHLTEDIMKV